MTKETGTYSELLERIISGIAYKPVEIIEREPGLRRVSFTCNVHPHDASLICGGRAIVIRSLQLIFKAIALKNRYICLSIYIDSERLDEPHYYEDFKSGWNADEAVQLALDLVGAFGHQIINCEVKQENEKVGLIITPELPEPLLTAVHEVLGAYGKSYGKIFGIVFE